jgi:outer membrane protein TolC
MLPRQTRFAVAVLAGLLAPAPGARAQAPEALTLRRAVALALQNSRELALARVQENVAERESGVRRSLFLPNLYTGSGAAYTKGFPQTPGGAAPSVFNLSYVQTVFNPPLRGQLRASEERERAQEYDLEGLRDAVILRTVTSCLELVKVRRSLDLLRRERVSAQKVLDVTRDRAGEGLELPVEITRAELSAARIEQRLLELEGREEALEADLRNLMGLPAGQRIALAEEELPASAGQRVEELVAEAMQNNPGLKKAEAERRAREHRLKGERGGYWPSVDLVGHYGVFSKVNNFDDFFQRFERHNVNIGISARIPIFSAQTSAAVNLARSELTAAELEVKNKRSDLDAEVRRQARAARTKEAAREVARLELKLVQEDVRVTQARFEEGRASLRDLEKARIEESDRWMRFLDAEWERQQAQLELLRTTGQLARLFH